MTREELLKDAQEARSLGDSDLELSILEKIDSLQPEKPPVNRFLSGVGGEVLKAASNIPVLPESIRGTLGEAGQQGLASATGTAGGIGKFVGSTAPYMALPAGGVLKTAAMAGGLSGLTSEGGLEERAIEAGKTAAGSAAIGGLAKGLRGFKPSAEAEQYMQQGIQPTLGQGVDKSGIIGKGIGKFEEATKSIPFGGSATTHARERASGEWMQNVFKKAEIPELGIKTDNAVGHEAIGKLQSGFNNAYNSVLKNEELKRTPAMARDIVNIVKTAPDIQKVVEKELSTLGTGATINADSLHRAIASLRDTGHRYSISPSAAEHYQGEALKDVASSLRQYMGSRLAPEKLAELNKIDSKYGTFKTLQRAAGMVGAEDGKISGSQLLNAVRAMDKTKDKSAFGRGEALLQKEAKSAKKVFGDTLSESGTTPRALAATALGLGAGTLNPWAYVAPVVQWAGSVRPVQKALLGGYKSQNKLSDVLRRTMQPAAAGAINEE
jgi:hypothetical protein